MQFFDLAQSLCDIYPEHGLLVASPDAPLQPPRLQVIVVSRWTAKAVAIAAVESEESLDASSQATWYWLGLLGIPVDVFVPHTKLEEANRIAERNGLRIRRIIPYGRSELSVGPENNDVCAPTATALPNQGLHGMPSNHAGVRS